MGDSGEADLGNWADALASEECFGSTQRVHHRVVEETISSGGVEPELRDLAQDSLQVAGALSAKRTSGSGRAEPGAAF